MPCKWHRARVRALICQTRADMQKRVLGQSGAHGFTSSRRSSSLKVTITSCESTAERPARLSRAPTNLRCVMRTNAYPSSASAASLPRRSNGCGKPGRARRNAAASNQVAPLPRFGSVARGRGERACAGVANLGANRGAPCTAAGAVSLQRARPPSSRQLPFARSWCCHASLVFPPDSLPHGCGQSH